MENGKQYTQRADAITDAIDKLKQILEQIDERWPEKQATA